jgi:hypothetical protein
MSSGNNTPQKTTRSGLLASTKRTKANFNNALLCKANRTPYVRFNCFKSAIGGVFDQSIKRAKAHY